MESSEETMFTGKKVMKEPDFTEDEERMFDFPDEWGNLDIEEMIDSAQGISGGYKGPKLMEIEEPEEPTDYEVIQMIDRIKKSTTLYNLRASDWTDELDQVINTYVRNPKIKQLIIYYDQLDKLCVSYEFPKMRIFDLQYFLKIISNKNLRPDNFDDIIISSTVDGNVESSIFRIMQLVYAPILYTMKTYHKYFNEWWHDKLTNFLIELASIKGTMSGSLVVHVPFDVLKMNIHKASQDASIVKRLNIVLLSWYVAIRDVLNEIEVFQENKNIQNPVYELEVWRLLYRNICGAWSILRSKTLGTICKILIEGQSIYVKLFFSVAGPVKEAIKLTHSNVKYFQLFEIPFAKIRAAETPSDVILLVPRILFIIRYIWLHSPYYNTEAHLNKLCTIFSNGISKYLSQYINPDEILNGKPKAGLKILHEVIDCCEGYKKLYQKAVSLHNKYNSRKWPEFPNVFILVDKLVIRCKEFINICNSMLTFGRIEDDGIVPPPRFAWSHSLEKTHYWSRIEDEYYKYLTRTIKGQDLLLELESEEWNEYYLPFKEGMDKVELMIEDLMSTAFSTIDNFEEGLEIIQSFVRCSKRINLTGIFEQCTVKIYELLLSEAYDTKKDVTFERKNIPRIYSRYGGRALLAYLKNTRLIELYSKIRNAPWLPSCGVKEVTDQKCKAIISYIDRVKMRHYNKWLSLLPKDLKVYYNKPIFKPSINGKHFIANNIDRRLFSLFKDVQCWWWIFLDIPEHALKIFDMQKSFHIINAGVEKLIINNNKLLVGLSQTEKFIFSGYLTKLDGHLKIGMETNCDWNKGQSLLYLKDSIIMVESLQKVIAIYKKTTEETFEMIVAMAYKSFLSLPDEFKYTLTEFKHILKSSRVNTMDDIRVVRSNVLGNIRFLERLLEKNIESAKPYWIAFVHHIDILFKDALRCIVAKSLETLLRFLQGDKRYQRTQFINIMILSRDSKLQFQPSMLYIIMVIKSYFYKLLAAVNEFPRFLEELEIEVARKPFPYVTEILKDKRILNINSCIEMEIIRIIQGLQAYLTIWLDYRDLWEVNENVFLKRYSSKDASLKDYTEELNRYLNLCKEIDIIKPLSRIHYIYIDSTKLKEQMKHKCINWHNEIKYSLAHKVAGKIENVHRYLFINTKRIQITPKTLDEIRKMKAYFEDLHEKNKKKDEVFTEIQDLMEILEWYEFPFPPIMYKRVEEMKSLWDTFQKEAEMCEKVLINAQGKFTEVIEKAKERFRKELEALIENFERKGPTTKEWGEPRDALDFIENVRKECTDAMIKEKKLRSELNVETEDMRIYSADFLVAARKIDILESVWLIRQEWLETLESLLHDNIHSLNDDEIKDKIESLEEPLNKINKYVKTWPVIKQTLQEIEDINNVLPVVYALQDKALKLSHWEKIVSSLPDKFNDNTDVNIENLTIETIIRLGLIDNMDIIYPIVEAAREENLAETTLKSMKEKWNTRELEMERYKKTKVYQIYKINKIEREIRDQHLSLYEVKNAKYPQPFLFEVNFWDKTLSLMGDLIDYIKRMQDRFFYLENVLGRGDLRKQLPYEYQLYDALHVNWETLTTTFYQCKTVYKITHLPDLRSKLDGISDEIDHLHRTLDTFLEQLRFTFTRFCFVPNDELLQTIGARNPNDINYLNMFFNIKRISVVKKPSKKYPEGIGVVSSDGEKVLWLEPVPFKGAIEDWLNEVETSTQTALKEYFKSTLKELTEAEDELSWAENNLGQLCIATFKIMWTAECMTIMENGEEIIWHYKEMKKDHLRIINRFIKAVKRNTCTSYRKKFETLITSEIYNIDVLQRLIDLRIKDVHSFDWISQLRYFWNRDLNICEIKQTLSTIRYGYEFIGNPDYLIITPLTERVFLGTTLALRLCRGIRPRGPTGVGKTETMMQLAKFLAKYFIINNTQAGVDNKCIKRLFMGVATTGCWACFEDWSVLSKELLATVTQYVITVLNALASREKTFNFHGLLVNLKPSLAIIITTRAGKAINKPTPQFLKVLLRPISLMYPDKYLICEYMLLREGFDNPKMLAHKIHTFFTMCEQSIQSNIQYDNSLRILVSLVKYAGDKKRNNPNFTDEEAVLYAIMNVHHCKMYADDYATVVKILRTLFPKVLHQDTSNQDIKDAIEEECKINGLQCTKYLTQKVVQLCEMKFVRPSMILIGRAGSAKSTIWKMLQAVKNRFHRENPNCYPYVKWHALNPTVLSAGDLYGLNNPETNDWEEGIFTRLLKQICYEKTSDEHWIILDAPLNQWWAENLNCLLDENRSLSTTSGGKIILTDKVSVIIETDSLVDASPSTVTRCGIVYCDVEKVSWRIFVKNWLSKLHNKQFRDALHKYFELYLDSMFEYKATHCYEVVKIANNSAVKALCDILSLIIQPKIEADMNTHLEYEKKVLAGFLFSMIWSVCSTVITEDRRKIDSQIRYLCPDMYPAEGTVFDYYLDGSWYVKHVNEMANFSSWKYDPTLPFHKNVPFSGTRWCYQMLLKTFVRAGKLVMIIGELGVGKTYLLESIMDEFPTNENARLRVSFTYQVTATKLQQIIEKRTEMMSVGVYAPPRGRKLVAFFDDFNLPQKTAPGCQPAIELLRKWIDYGYWYNNKLKSYFYLKDMKIMGAMGPHGGGRNVLSERILKNFFVLNVGFPSDLEIKTIFSMMIESHTNGFKESLQDLGPTLTELSMRMINNVRRILLPAPTKQHYVFSFRDVLEFINGLMRYKPLPADDRFSIQRLWLHEAWRTFGDRLVTEKDRIAFNRELLEEFEAEFLIYSSAFYDRNTSPSYCNFMKEDFSYEYVELDEITKFIAEKINEFNRELNVSLNLALFKTVVDEVCQITRIISQPNYHLLFIGLGGSGRKSISILASMLCLYKTYVIDLSKNYGIKEFINDLKAVYDYTGINGEDTSFIISDSQVIDEDFLYIVSNVISSGEVYKTNGDDLYSENELLKIIDYLKPEALRQEIDLNLDNIQTYLSDRVRKHIHMMVILNPLSDQFYMRLKCNPVLTSQCSILWTSEWPTEALSDTAKHCLANFEIKVAVHDPVDEIERILFGDAPPEKLASLCTVFSKVHDSVSTYSKFMVEEGKMYNYVSIVHFLEMIRHYKTDLFLKRRETAYKSSKLSLGLEKMQEVKDRVGDLNDIFIERGNEIKKLNKLCEVYMEEVRKQTTEATEMKAIVASNAIKIKEEEMECKVMAEQALADLEAVTPAIENAVKGLQAIDRKDLNEIRTSDSPPTPIKKVMEAVMVLRQLQPTWSRARYELADVHFLKKLLLFDKENIPDNVLLQLSKYTRDPEFEPETLETVSLAIKSIAIWVLAIENYATVLRSVKPKREALDKAVLSLESKQQQFEAARKEVQELEALLVHLKDQYDKNTAEKNILIHENEVLRLKLDRANAFILHLADENDKWLATIEALTENYEKLQGDCVLASAFLVYLGPFVSTRRRAFIDLWMQYLREDDIRSSETMDVGRFEVTSSIASEWVESGLPDDAINIENGLIVTMSQRWPLIIDPHLQSYKWIKNIESANHLKIVEFDVDDVITIIEQSMASGSPVLIHNVKNYIDSAMLPILNKCIVTAGDLVRLQFGQRLIPYEESFRLYMLTRNPSPRNVPDIAIKLSMVNFSLNEDGLKHQLLGVLINIENRQLEKHLKLQDIEVTAARKLYGEFEESLLEKLSSQEQGSIIDDSELLQIVKELKNAAEVLLSQIKSMENQIWETLLLRQEYQPCATRAAILFLTMDAISKLDPVYKFSLQRFTKFFKDTINSGKVALDTDTRLASIAEYFTDAVYRRASTALYSKHRLTFLFLITIKILISKGELVKEQLEYLLYASSFCEQSDTNMHNPISDWLSNEKWANLCALMKVPGFPDILDTFDQEDIEWKNWYDSDEPEAKPFIESVEVECKGFHRVLLIRAIRPDRIVVAMNKFIKEKFGLKFVDLEPNSLSEIFDYASYTTPVFILNSSVHSQPDHKIKELAKVYHMENKFFQVRLGDGVEQLAERLIEEGRKYGYWIFLENCHDLISWMPRLDKIIEGMQRKRSSHLNFRLWLSSISHPELPDSALRMSQRIAEEPPKTLKKCMIHYSKRITYPDLADCDKTETFHKLLFALTFFHSMIKARSKFGNIGWSSDFTFALCDIKDSINITNTLLENYETMPWTYLKFLIAELCYAGNVNTFWDQRIINVLINDIINQRTVSEDNFRLTPLRHYYIPNNTQGKPPFIKFINCVWPEEETPEIFGIHSNVHVILTADVSKDYLNTLLLLPLDLHAVSKQTKEEQVSSTAFDIITKIYPPVDYEFAKKQLQRVSITNSMLLNEVFLYNKLADLIRLSTDCLLKAIQGKIIITDDLEDIFYKLYKKEVPDCWSKAYPTRRNLPQWIDNLELRINYIRDKVFNLSIRPHWLSSYICPNRFLTAALIEAAENRGLHMDALTWEYVPQLVDDVRNLNDVDKMQWNLPREGLLVRGFWLEGAGWNPRKMMLIEPKPGKYITYLSPIYFKPVLKTEKVVRDDMYVCPVYYCPDRQAHKSTLVCAIEINKGQETCGHWVKRGTAVLLNHPY